MGNHPGYFRPTGDEPTRELSKAYAMWEIAYELHRIADAMEGDDDE